MADVILELLPLLVTVATSFLAGLYFYSQTEVVSPLENGSVRGTHFRPDLPGGQSSADLRLMGGIPRCLGDSWEAAYVVTRRSICWPVLQVSDGNRLPQPDHLSPLQNSAEAILGVTGLRQSSLPAGPSRSN